MTGEADVHASGGDEHDSAGGGDEELDEGGMEDKAKDAMWESPSRRTGVVRRRSRLGERRGGLQARDIVVATMYGRVTHMI
jgi:hypothetical protein